MNEIIVCFIVAIVFLSLLIIRLKKFQTLSLLEFTDEVWEDISLILAKAIPIIREEVGKEVK